MVERGKVFEDRDMGTWARDEHGIWHWSTSFDGHRHGLACGGVIEPDGYGVQMDREPTPSGDVCSFCQKAREGPLNRNPNAMTIAMPSTDQRAQYVRFAIGLNHDEDDVLPDQIRENPLHLPVDLDGVVP